MLEEYVFPACFLCFALILFSYKSDYTFNSNLLVFFSTIFYLVGIDYLAFGQKPLLPELLWVFLMMFFIIFRYNYSVVRFFCAAILFFVISYGYQEYGAEPLHGFVNWFDRLITNQQ